MRGFGEELVDGEIFRVGRPDEGNAAVFFFDAVTDLQSSGHSDIWNSLASTTSAASVPFGLGKLVPAPPRV